VECGGDPDRQDSAIKEMFKKILAAARAVIDEEWQKIEDGK
jgi:hypothetical protein